MAMTLRLSEEETEALRARAAIDGVSMHEVARRAIGEYVANRRARLDVGIDRVLVEDAELLDRLGK